MRKALRRLLRGGSRNVAGAPPDGTDPGRPGTPTSEAESAERLFDRLVGQLGFDSSDPKWSDALRALHRASRARHLQLIPDFFYTPVCPGGPARRGLGRHLPGMRHVRSRGAASLPPRDAVLREGAFSASVRAAALGPYDLLLGNDQFSHSDASLYYSLIRRFRPRRIIEVGAGHSTKLAARAIRDNGSGRILCIDPHAPQWLGALEGKIEVVARPVQETPDSVFLGLEPSDILFIDGSHISKTGSDVNHLFLRILPRIPKGVIVHIHDICLPFEYQKAWSEDVLCY